MDASDNGSLKFATKKRYVINDKNNTEYGERHENDSNIKFETKVIKSNICDCLDAYILATADLTAAGGDENTKVVFTSISMLYLLCLCTI